jgi:restriction system protein
MELTQATIWGVRAGKGGEADTLFLTNCVVALGLEKVGKLQAQSDRQSIKRAIVASYPGTSATALARNAGQLFHFLHDIRTDDLVVYPSRIDGAVHIGVIQGPYYYDFSLLAEYPHRRPVKWLVSAPRDRFSQAALFEMGAATTLFRIRRHADEFYEAARKDKWK